MSRLTWDLRNAKEQATCGGPEGRERHAGKVGAAGGSNGGQTSLSVCRELEMAWGQGSTDLRSKMVRDKKRLACPAAACKGSYSLSCR